MVVIRTVGSNQFEIDLQDRSFISSNQKELATSRTRGQAQREIGSRSVGPNGPDPWGETPAPCLRLDSVQYYLGENNSRHPSIIHDKLAIEITTNGVNPAP